MSITLSALQKQRRDTAANWTAENPTLLAGEIGLESDTGYWKVGNGSTAWISLAYVTGLGAEIPVSRLADGSARQLLQTATNGTDVEWTSNVDVPGTLDVTGAATFDAAVTIQGDLTVNGTTTTIDTQNLIVEDKNVIIGNVTSPTDATADGGGITLKGTTDKTINWIDATDAWTSSEHVNIANGKEYRINGTKVLDATSLGSSVLITSANITDGTIVNGDVSASAAIAGTKISPDFGSQNVTTTGTATAAALIPSGSSVPTNGVYLPSSNNVAISTNGTGRLFVDASGRVSLGTSSASANLHILSSSGADVKVACSALTPNSELNLWEGAGVSGNADTTRLGVGKNNTSLIYANSTATARTAFAIGTSDAVPLVFSTNNAERARIDSSGRLLVGTSTATGAAILQVQTPTTLSTTADNGVNFVNTSTKVYPATASFSVTAGLNKNIELGTAQTINTVTPGGFNFVTGTNITLTKSAGNTQDIERLYFNGFQQNFTWTDANTCKQYVGFTDNFNYSGFDANSRTSQALFAANITLSTPDTRTQTIATVTSNSLTLLQGGTSTVNITNWSRVSPSLFYYNFSAGTKTSSITNAAFYDTSSFWGVQGTTGTVAATITNLFGLRLRPPFNTTGLTITNNWGLYQEWSSAKNWFAGASNQFPNITTTASGANAFLDSADSNRIYRSTSSLTYKRDVEDLDSSLADQILNLRPVWYRSKCAADCEDWSWYGLIAEEVAEIDPRFVHYGYQEDAYQFIETTETVELPPNDPRREGGLETEEVTRQERQLKADAQQVPNGVAYERLVVPLLDIIKRQKSQLESFEARLAALEAR